MVAPVHLFDDMTDHTPQPKDLLLANVTGFAVKLPAIYSGRLLVRTGGYQDRNVVLQHRVKTSRVIERTVWYLHDRVSLPVNDTVTESGRLPPDGTVYLEKFPAAPGSGVPVLFRSGQIPGRVDECGKLGHCDQHPADLIRRQHDAVLWHLYGKRILVDGGIAAHE